MAIEPKNVESDEHNRHIGRRCREQIGAVRFPPEPLLQIEERQLAAFFKSNDLAVEDKIDIELVRLVRELGTLIGDAAQIARINLSALGGALQLRRNRIALVFDETGQ